MRFGASFVGVRGLGIGFLIGFLVRLVPELLAFPFPIGFDTVYYAVVMKSGVILPHWSAFFTSSWLLSALTVPLYSLSKVNPFLLLKIVSPALYGLNVAGVYWFARKMLGWDAKMCLVAVGLFAVQLAPLRISWDLLRNTLGMGLLLFSLSLISSLDSKRGFASFVFLSLLTVFAHEYSAVTLVVVILGLLAWNLLKGQLGKVDVRVVLAALPALAVFSVGMFLRFFPIKYSATTNVFSISEAYVGRSVFFANYLAVNDGVFYYPAYADLLVDVALLFAFLYLSYLFLVWKGFFRSVVLNLWTGLLLFGTFGCLVYPFFALDLWSRWMFMLGYPFTFYAVNGLFKILKNYNGGNGRFAGFSKRAVFGALGVTVLLGSVYLATPTLMGTVHTGVFALPNVSAHFSSAPTVPFEDVNGVVQAMEWLNQSMGSGSCVVLQHVFLSWGQLYLDKSHSIVHFLNDADVAANVALNRGFTQVYFVWWNTDIGWYSVSGLNHFERLVDFDRISVFAYVE